MWVALAVAVCSGFGALAYRAWRDDLLPPVPGSIDAMRAIGPAAEPPPVWPMWLLVVLAVLSVLLAVGLALTLWLRPE